MNARGKLNSAYLNGAIVLAVIAGLLTESALVFFVFLVGGVLLSLYLGNIRPTGCRSDRPGIGRTAALGHRETSRP